MDSSSLYYLWRLKLTLQLLLVAICAGFVRALGFVAYTGHYPAVEHLIQPQHGNLDYISAVAGALFLYKQMPKFGVFARFALLLEFEKGFTREFGRPPPSSAHYILPGLQIVACVVSYWFLYGISNLVLKPLQAFSPHLWGVQLLYAYIVLTLLGALIPEISFRSFGPSITAQVVSFLLYPYVVWLEWKRKSLAATFTSLPSSRHGFTTIFEYEPIREPGIFRLLKLTVARGRICATLQNFSTNNCPPYWAVSYVWGRESPSNSTDVRHLLRSPAGCWLLPHQRISDRCPLAQSLFSLRLDAVPAL